MYESSVMVTSSHPDNFTVRRLVRESLTLPSAPGSKTATASPDEASDQFVPGKLEEDVALSIRAIERVVENFGAMKENFSFYKELVAELTAKLDEEKAQREEFHRELVAMERIVKSERERSMRAEGAVKAYETTIRDLEHQLTSLRAQTSRLVKSVTSLISAEIDARGDEGDHGLRLVS